MIIGRIVFEIEALTDGHLPQSHGRLLHAAFLNAVRNINPVLSEHLHNSNIKEFAVRHLILKQKVNNNRYFIQKGERAFFCVSGVGEDFIRTILEMEQTLFHIAGISFIINKVYSSQKQLDIAGITSMEYLLEGVIQLPVMRSLTLQFLSPTLFRIGNSEYAAADSRLIFGSLAERWNAFSDGFKIDTDEIKQLALELNPINWQGETRRYNITPSRCVTGFVGKFTYDLSAVPKEKRYIFILLAEFGRFMGVGRLTAQGLGSIKISYNI